MLDFVPVTIADRKTIQPFFDKSIFGNCDFSFANIFCWKHLYETTFAVEDDFLYVRFQSEGSFPGYLYPLGDGDLTKALARIEEDAAARGQEMRLFSITREMFNRINSLQPDTFVYKPNRNWFEYLYSTDDLISLIGKKYQSKRNHINKFKRTYDWEYLPITREIIPDCLRLYDRWCAENGECSSAAVFAERIATQTAFMHYEDLQLTGSALRVNGEILAYSYGQALGKEIFGVHAEKSLYEIDGGFTIMNQQFAEHNCVGYKYINREEDLGIESLRQAKMSYHPAILLEKGTLLKAK